MGVYFKYLCVSNDKPVYQLNPQSGYGGMKAGEFIGSPSGKVMMKLLQTHFCPDGAKWGYVSDIGHSSWINLDGQELYEQSFKVPDVGRNADFRNIAIDKKLTTQKNIDWWDDVAETQKRFADVWDTDTLAFASPDLTAFIDKYNAGEQPVVTRTRSTAVKITVSN